MKYRFDHGMCSFQPAKHCLEAAKTRSSDGEDRIQRRESTEPPRLLPNEQVVAPLYSLEDRRDTRSAFGENFIQIQQADFWACFKSEFFTHRASASEYCRQLLVFWLFGVVSYIHVGVLIFGMGCVMGLLEVVERMKGLAELRRLANENIVSAAKVTAFYLRDCGDGVRARRVSPVELVPGDLIEIEENVILTADCVLVQTNNDASIVVIVGVYGIFSLHLTRNLLVLE